jgi:hypothetical protein
LKWLLQRDKLAQTFRDGALAFTIGSAGVSEKKPGLGLWLENRGRQVVPDSERLRLAICPEVKKMVGFFEHLGQ